MSGPACSWLYCTRQDCAREAVACEGLLLDAAGGVLLAGRLDAPARVLDWLAGEGFLSLAVAGRWLTLERPRLHGYLRLALSGDRLWISDAHITFSSGSRQCLLPTSRLAS